MDRFLSRRRAAMRDLQLLAHMMTSAVEAAARNPSRSTHLIKNYKNVVSYP